MGAVRRLAWVGMVGLCLGATACLLLHDLDALGNAAADDDDASGGDVDAPAVPVPDGGGPDATTPADAASEGGADGGAGCRGSAGPTPVRLPLGYCIDSTEVTVEQYAAFLASKGGDTSGQEGSCAGNDTYTPLFGMPPTSEGPTPIRYVDFCDAAAYCAWAGKRLCGDRDGGAVAEENRSDPKHSEWFAACSHNDDGVHPFPYGVDGELGRCNDAVAVQARDGGSDYSQAGQNPACEGGYAGLFDLSGNIGEWENGCSVQADGGVGCPVRGGSYYHDNLSALSCGGGDYGTLDAKTPGFGIRCCSDVQ